VIPRGDCGVFDSAGRGLKKSLQAFAGDAKDAGLVGGPSRCRGPESTRPDRRVAKAERENRRLRRRLEKAEAIIEVPRKSPRSWASP